MYHLTDDLVTWAQLADRYRAADLARLVQTYGRPEAPGRAALVRFGHLLVGIGRRLEALDTRCATAPRPPFGAATAAQEC